jgi:hypothetical protein
MEAGQGGWELVTNTLPVWDLRIKQPDPPRWRMPLIWVEDSKLGRRLRESKLGPTPGNTLINVASQQCRWRKLLDVAMRLAGIGQRLRAVGPQFCNVLTGIEAGMTALALPSPEMRTISSMPASGPLQSRGILIVRQRAGDSRWQAPACGWAKAPGTARPRAMAIARLCPRGRTARLVRVGKRARRRSELRRQCPARLPTYSQYPSRTSPSATPFTVPLVSHSNDAWNMSR